MNTLYQALYRETVNKKLRDSLTTALRARLLTDYPDTSVKITVLDVSVSDLQLSTELNVRATIVVTPLDKKIE